ncbi:alpha/beta hydrolase [Acinetobacter guillouiae]|uniref:alpha/beta fold hydrolase n=1 Tax=Acinetobacter guillouiae TaxID=106649 RepID=UPI0021CF92F4|nr:alpha/beta hydrolase [Acinetobacter guillouiae]MCU4492268.1 alpha/beta hydrolase [Acinetobacter guillouiae]
MSDSKNINSEEIIAARSADVILGPDSEGDCFWPSYAGYASYAIGLLDAIGYKGKFSVAGVFWGGALAQQIAHSYSHLISRMILIATTSGVTMVPGRLSAIFHMTTPQRYLSSNFMKRNAAHIYGGELRGHPENAAKISRLTKPLTVLAYLQRLIAGSKFSSLPWLWRIRCPVLVMAGDDNPIVRLINARILVRILPNAQLQIIKGGGHLFILMQPELTAKTVKSFLKMDCSQYPRYETASF